MASLLVEAVWLNDADVCSMDELVEYSGLSHAELAELVALGAIESRSESRKEPRSESGSGFKNESKNESSIVPNRNVGADQAFRAQTIVVARTARRLRDDFELDTPGLAVALSLLQRIQALETRLAAADARLPHPA